MLALVAADAARDGHAAVEQLDQLVVEAVNLEAHLGQPVARVGNAAQLQMRRELLQLVGGELLPGVAPRPCGVAVHLDHHPVEAQLHRLAGQRSDQLAPSADMARVAEQRQRGHAAAQLDGDGPLRRIAVTAAVGGAEAPVDGPQPSDAGVEQPLDAADPEVDVGTHGVLHQHGDVVSPQCVGNLLHGKGVRDGAGPQPQQVDAGIECRSNVLARGDLGGHAHPRFAPHALHPDEPRRAYTLEAARLGAGLPESGAEDAQPLCGQRAGGGQELLFGLGAAGAGDEQRTSGVEVGKEGAELCHGRAMRRRAVRRPSADGFSGTKIAFCRHNAAPGAPRRAIFRRHGPCGHPAAPSSCRTLFSPRRHRTAFPGRRRSVAYPCCRTRLPFVPSAAGTKKPRILVRCAVFRGWHPGALCGPEPLLCGD